MTMTYSGAYRSCSYGGGIDWVMTQDDAELLRRADEDDEQVLWASTPEELYCLLEERYPGRCRLWKEGCGCSVYPHPVVTADGLPDDGKRDDAFAARIVAAAAKHGTVWVCSSIPDAVWESCVRGDGHYAVTYDPVEAQKRKSARVKADQRRPLPTRSFYRVAQRLHHFLSYVPLADIGSNEGRLNYLYWIRCSLWLCERLYGKRSYRRLACWHEFVSDWRQRRKPTEKALAHAAANGSDREAVTEFVEFMARECRRRLPPVAADDEVRTREPQLPH